jgi:hypothetical protein
MSGSLPASAPPLTVIQKNGAGATRQMSSHERTDPQATPRRAAGATCPARMQTRKIKGSSMSVPPMPDPARPSSTKVQYKITESADLHAAFCTTKPETTANSRDPGPISLPEPHAFLAGHLQNAGSIRPRAVKKENSKILQRTDTTTAVSATEPETAADNHKSEETALWNSSAFLAGLKRSAQPTPQCAKGNKRTPTSQRAKPPTPSLSYVMSSTGSLRKTIRRLPHTLSGCSDGQQRISSDALRERLPNMIRAMAHRAPPHKMSTTIRMMMMRLTAKMNLTMSATTTMIATNSSNSQRGSGRYPVPEPKRVLAGPWPAPAAHCTRTGAARATPLEPPKLSEHGTIFQSSAAETAATHSSISRRHAAKPTPKAEQTSTLGTDVEDRPAPTTTDAIDSQNDNSPKLTKSTAERDCWLAGQPTEWTTRSTCTTESTRAREQPKHDKQPNARLPNFMRDSPLSD